MSDADVLLEAIAEAAQPIDDPIPSLLRRRDQRRRRRRGGVAFLALVLAAAGVLLPVLAFTPPSERQPSGRITENPCPAGTGLVPSPASSYTGDVPLGQPGRFFRNFPYPSGA